VAATETKEQKLLSADLCDNQLHRNLFIGGRRLILGKYIHTISVLRLI